MVAVFGAAVGYYAAVDGRLYVRGGTPLLWALAALALVFAFSTALSFFTSIWGATGRDMRFTLGQLLSVWYLRVTAWRARRTYGHDSKSRKKPRSPRLHLRT